LTWPNLEWKFFFCRFTFKETNKEFTDMTKCTSPCNLSFS
jgi:hypothetical protein